MKRLYAAGAVRVEVWVGYDKPSRVRKEGGHYADHLFVYGPPGPPETRRKLTEVVKSLSVPTESDDEANPGEGPEYELWWD